MPDHAREHQKAQAEIRKLLMFSMPGHIVLWPNVTGMAWLGKLSKNGPICNVADARPVHFGLPSAGGGADLVGIFLNSRESGIFLAIEIKTGKAKRRPKQEGFSMAINDMGGICVQISKIGPGKFKIIKDSWLSWESMKFIKAITPIIEGLGDEENRAEILPR